MKRDKRHFSKRKERNKIIIESSSSNSDMSSVIWKSNNSDSYKISDTSHKDKDYYNQKVLDKKKRWTKEESNKLHKKYGFN